MSPWLGLDRLFFQVVRLFLGWLTRGTTLPADSASLNLDPDKPVVFVLRDASLANTLVVEKSARQFGLKSPMASLTVGNQELRRASFNIYRRRALIGRERLAVNPKRLQQVVTALHQDSELDVQLVPVSVFWGRRPEKENSIWRILFSDNWSPPGIIKKFFMILLQGRQLVVDFSPAMPLRQLVDEGMDEERTARKALRILRVHFRRQQEAAIGPDLSHRRTLVNSLVDSSAVRAALEATAREEQVPLEKLEARARRYAMEIAADYSHTVIRFLEILLNWVWNRLYDGIRLYNMDRLRHVAQDHEVIYVPCHRSHIDYLLLSFVVFRNNLVPPHIAAGINLNLPVVGTILRRGGAFFMRRSFRGNPIYAAVFNEYMHVIMSRGFSIEYFVEGGRSRSGRMLSPKTGMLAMTVRSFLRDAQKPVALVPVYIGYEKVIEARTYIGEMTGKNKKKESVFGLVRSSLSFLRSHFGQVHVNFGDPIVLADYLDDQAPKWRDDARQKTQEPDWLKDTVNHLGEEVVSRINAAAVANPVNLLSLAVLGTPKRTMDEEQLRQQLELYLTLLQQAPYSADSLVSETSAGAIIDYGIEHEFLRRIEHPHGNLVTADDVTALQMTYVRNNALHLFILPGLISALFRHGREMQSEQLHQVINLLYPFFRTEYFLHWREQAQVDQAIDAVLEVLISQGLVERHGDSLRGAPLHTRQAELLEHLGQTVLQVLERFSLTIRVLVQHGSGVLSAESLEEIAHQTAQRLSLLYEFNSPEFFDRNVLRNFIRQLGYYGLVQLEGESLIFDERLQALDDEAARVLSPEVSQTISRLTRLPLELQEDSSATASDEQQKKSA